MPRVSEKAKQKKIAYDMRYSHENIKKKLIPFNMLIPDDSRMLEWLNQQDNITKYIKGLILKDMERAGK